MPSWTLGERIGVTREQATKLVEGEDAAAQTTTDGPSTNRAIMSGDVAEVVRLMQAQPALRDNLLGELHRSQGNAFVQQVLTTIASTGAFKHEEGHEAVARSEGNPELDKLRSTKTPDSAEDQAANREPSLLWQRQTGPGGVVSETKNSADSSTNDRRPETERQADQSDNATYHAMNVRLKLLAFELHAAGKKLSFDVAVANAAKKQDKAQITETDARLSATVQRLDDLAQDTAGQLRSLNTVKSEPRLAEGGQNLSAALDEFAPVMADDDIWMTNHKLDTLSWEVVGRSNGILKLVFPGVAPVAKPLTSVEESPGFMKEASIDAHLDAAIAAAESVRTGNRYQADRVIMHAKEVAELLKNRPRIPGGLEPRIMKLLSIVDRILVDNPYLTTSFGEALGPIRNVK